MAKEHNYLLHLYIAGITAENQSNILRIKQLLKEKLKNRYVLKVIDVFINPELAERDTIVATPMLIKKTPQPVEKIILDFNNESKLQLGLSLFFKED